MLPEVARLYAERLPLPEGTEIYNKWGEWVPLSKELLRTANKAPHHLHDTEPFWLHGWRDLHGSLRVGADTTVDKP